MHEAGRWRWEVQAMTRRAIIVKAIAGELTWLQAADILGVTARQLRRLKRQFERQGYDGLRDHRGGTPRRKRIPLRVIRRLCTLRRGRYADFSIRHFLERATAQPRVRLSFPWRRPAV